MRHLPPEDEQLRIAVALYRLRMAGQLPRIWIDGNSIRIEARKWSIHPITWAQAFRLAAGEPLESVVCVRKGQGVDAPAVAAEERCA